MVLTGVLALSSTVPEILRPYKSYLASVGLPGSVSEVRQFCPNYRRSAVMVLTEVLASSSTIPEILRPYKSYLASLAFPASLSVLTSEVI